MRPRWRKLLGDLRASWGRLVAMQLAMALALSAVGAVLGARAVLRPAIRASYLATRPADMTIELAGGVDHALLAAVRARPEVAAADRRQMVRARVKKQPGDPWQMLVLFVADFADLRLGTFRPERGAWPPPPGTLLLERTAPVVMGIPAPVDRGAAVTIQTPHGPPRSIGIAGTVHDAGQAPSWQEGRGYAYATVETLAMLGERPLLGDLLVQLRPAPASSAEVENAAEGLVAWLRAQGRAVHEVRVPNLRQHPHQGLLDGVQIAMLVFSLVLLMLGAIVIATILSSILARQVREIGVMKAIGASTGQLVRLYATFIAVMGGIAVAIAAPLGAEGASAMIGGTARLMNISVVEPGVPWWAFAVQAALGVLVPLAIASVPILRATGRSVRQALAIGDGGSGVARPSLARLPMAVRNALRHPVRLAWTAGLLVAGAAFAMAAANIDRGLMSVSALLADARHFDVEIRLHEAVGREQVAGLGAVAGVDRLEAWAIADASYARPGQDVDVVHTYPDGGHGSFALTALPSAGSELVSFPLVAGRWLTEDDTDSIVLGVNASRGARVGDRVTLSVEGRRSTWVVVGLVQEVAGASAFVTEAGFRRATGQNGVALLRIATTARGGVERAAVIAELEAALAAAGVGVAYAMPSQVMRSIIDAHVVLIARIVIGLAGVVGLVGLLGLASAIAIGVAERTREIAVMKAIGASDGRVFRIIVGEAVLVGAGSALIAVIVSIGLTVVVEAMLGGAGLIGAAPMRISTSALVVCPLAAIAGSGVASWWPARRAARLSVRHALAEV
jgi:putative ABC transport system permease protein